MAKHVTENNAKELLAPNFYNKDEVSLELNKKANLTQIGTPLTATNIAGMTDTTKVYVNTTDGKWYSYNGTAWVAGGVYNSLAIGDGTVSAKKTDFIELVEVGVTDINLNSNFTLVGSISNTNGNLNAGNTSYKSTDFIQLIDVKYLFRYVLDGTNSGLFTDFMLAFYDTNKVFISGLNRGTSYTVETYNGKYGCYYPIPTNAVYVRFSCNNNNIVGGGGNLYTYLYVKKNFKNRLLSNFDAKTDEDLKVILTNALKQDNSSVSNLNGKKVVCFGDSIFGNFQDATGIPSLLAKNTGATVYNLGFGGTRMAKRNDVNSQSSYWSEFSFASIVEQIEINDFTRMKTALPNMTSALSYFSASISLLESINWNEIDIVTWEYGTNDFTGANIVKNESDLTNLYTYYGAYCHAIEKLLTKYPHLRIILITPMYRFWDIGGVYQYDSDTHVINNQKLTDFVSCVKEVAQKYHLPIIDNYYGMDANKFTRTQYFDATDGTHPNENGRKRFADRITHQFEVSI